MRRLHLAILRAAARLVPHSQRDEWQAEWKSELWYVCPSQATSFCLGAFRDALWLRRHHPFSFRLESPLQCLSVLVFLAAASVLYTFERPVDPDTRGPANLVMISPAGHRDAPIRFKQYKSWNNRWQRVFTRLAFYAPSVERVRVSLGRNAELSVARASDNLFQVLNASVPPLRPNSLLLSRTAWREFFNGDPGIAGRVLEIGGRQVEISGVIPEDPWQLPVRIDAWLLEDPRSLDALPPDSQGFVLARVSRSSIRRMFAPNGRGGEDKFDCLALAGRTYHPLIAFAMIVVFSGLLLPVTTSLSLGDYPANNNLRRWIFLAAKLAPILAMVYCGARFVAYNGLPVHGVLVASILALRWAIVDQRQRCPVCLRLVSHPVTVGRTSQTFLEWYGTEFICAKGHGLLHVPEIVTSSYSTQRWLCLDQSWSGLF